MTLTSFRALARPRFLAAGPLGIVAAFVLMSPASAQGPNGNRCARYGDDYVAVAGSDGCVRLGGHVRVDIARGPVAPMGYAAVQDGVQRASDRSAPAHVIAPFGLNDLFPR